MYRYSEDKNNIVSIKSLSLKIVFTIVIVFACSFVAVLISLLVEKSMNASITKLSKPVEVVKITEEPDPTLTLAFTGDIMVHSTQYKSAYDKETQSYNFDSSFVDIAPFLSGFDRTIGNLETPVAPELSLGSYPNFNAPVEILYALKNAGFDILTLANNHAMDRGAKGAETTLQNTLEIGLIPLGTNIDEINYYQPVIETVNGISVAYIAATEHLNGYKLPKDKQHLVQIIDNEKILSAITESKNKGADIVVVLPHWGNEYSRKETLEQETLAQGWVEAGADIVVGSHPHVLQPLVEHITQDQRRVVVAYSLGNFVSNQQDNYTDLGGVLTVKIRKDNKTKQTNIEEYKLVPIFVERTKKQKKIEYRVLTLENSLNYLEDYSKKIQERIVKYKIEYLPEL